MAQTDITLLTNVGLNDTATNDNTSTVGEPSIAVSGSQVFMSGNWYASRSRTPACRGLTWTRSPALPRRREDSAATSCAPRTPAPGVDLDLQYSRRTGRTFSGLRRPATRTSRGGAVMVGHRPGHAERPVDQRLVRLPGCGADQRPSLGHVQRLQQHGPVAARRGHEFPLATIASAGSLGFNWWSTTRNGSLQLTQGAGHTMYWGSHSSNQLRLFRWDTALPSAGGT